MYTRDGAGIRRGKPPHCCLRSCPLRMTSSGSLPKLPAQTEIPRPVLNRLFIVIGALAILAIAAAFAVPRFIQWGDYRDRMQAIASEVLGAPVEIVGDIEFALLPQPQ